MGDWRDRSQEILRFGEYSKIRSLYCVSTSFDEIAFFKDTTHMGIQGGLICYNKNKKKLFSVEAIHIGVSLIIQRLREKNIAQMF